MLRAALFRSAPGLRRSPAMAAASGAPPFSTAAAARGSPTAPPPLRLGPRVRLFIGQEFVKSHVDVTNPATQEVVSPIPLTTADEFRAAVDAARTAFPGWRNTPVTTRQRVMFKFQEFIPKFP